MIYVCVFALYYKINNLLFVWMLILYVRGFGSLFYDFITNKCFIYKH